VRVGIDLRPALYGRGGIGQYARWIALALARAYPLERFAWYGHRLRERGSRRPLGEIPANVALHERRWPSMATEALARLGYGADRLLGGVDVLHWTDYVPLRSTHAPVVATVHDVLWTTLPECYAPGMTWALGAFLARAKREATRFVVPSERTKRDLAEHGGVAFDRIDVAAHGTPPLPEARGPRRGAREHGPYVLAVGTLEPRKNHLRLLLAMDRVRARGLDVRLVLAGARGWLDEPILAAVAARPWVTWEGSVDEVRKAALLRGARALAYPSLGEGFGLPVLEGFAAGAPVLVGADTACSDLAGDAALAADPRDVDALAAGLARLIEDEPLRARLVERGRAVAAAHTWERAARATHACYERAIAG
jgi:glycosyltransferase involved in cell wall biosynthesis